MHHKEIITDELIEARQLTVFLHTTLKSPQVSSNAHHKEKDTTKEQV